MVDKRLVVEEILKLNELVRAEKVESFRGRRIATWGNPGVEYAYQNVETLNTIGFVFPEQSDGTETWTQKALETLNSYDSCVMCFSAGLLSDANYFCDYLHLKALDTLPVGVIVYDSSLRLIVLKMYSLPDTSTKARSKSEQKSYWCWWRDASQYEVVTLLELSEKYDDDEEDIYTKKVYPEFYNMMINQETKQWDGSPRKKNYSQASFKSEKQNYKIPMCQLGLWEAEKGHIMPKGRAMLEVARRNGADSNVFLAYLSKVILLDGKHLDLIKDLDEFQKSSPEEIPEASSDFFILFDNYMENKNSIGTRKPSAVTTGAKRSYVRDEPKLWNKLGIIIPSGKGRYYWPFKGIKFDWQKINEILLSSGNEEG